MTTLKANDLLVQIRELRVAIGMTAALTGFAGLLRKLNPASRNSDATVL